MTDLEFLEAQNAGLERALRAMTASIRDDYARAALTGLLVYGYRSRELVIDEAFKIADLALEHRK